MGEGVFSDDPILIQAVEVNRHPSGNEFWLFDAQGVKVVLPFSVVKTILEEAVLW